MGGSQESNAGRQSRTSETSTVTPTGIGRYQGDFGTAYNRLYNQFSNITKEPLNLKSAPAFSSGFDPVVQNAISKGIQGIKAGQNTAGIQTANALNTAGTGSNSALLNVLNRQAAISGGGATNALYGGGIEQQRQQDIARQSIIAQQNQDILAKRNAQISGLTPGMNLLQSIIQMGQLSRGERRVGTRTTDEAQQQSTGQSFI